VIGHKVLAYGLMKKSFWLFLLSAALLGLGLAWLDGRPWLPGWGAYSLLIGVGFGAFGLTWRTVGGSSCWKMALAAAVLRLGVGMGLMLALPVFGYTANEVHQNGYFYRDAMRRDNQAWQLAVSGKPLSVAFSGQINDDQYGGMLAFSAAIYRFISPDAHRPGLLLVVGAAAAACGTLFLEAAVRLWFGAAVARKSAWLFALYPEAVLLGGTHMREMLILPAMGLSVYALAEFQTGRRTAGLWMLGAMAVLLAISPLAALAALLPLAGFWWFAPERTRGSVTWRLGALFAGLFLVGAFIAYSVMSRLPALQGANILQTAFGWLQSNFSFQAHLADRASGPLQGLLRQVGEQWGWLVVMVYGLAQPVLPAVVGDPDAAALMRLIGFLRAAGWYALAPLMVYALAGAWRSGSRRGQLLWLAAALWGWAMLTALQGGGDQWDTPRYRVFLLPWMVLLSGWAWQWAIERRDPWLGRWLGVEAFFVLSFTEWYITRYIYQFAHLSLPVMIGLNLVAAGLILGSGVLAGRLRKTR